MKMGIRGARRGDALSKERVWGEGNKERGTGKMERRVPRQRRVGEAQWDNGAERGRERTGRMAEKDGPAGR